MPEFWLSFASFVDVPLFAFSPVPFLQVPAASLPPSPRKSRLFPSFCSSSLPVHLPRSNICPLFGHRGFRLGLRRVFQQIIVASSLSTIPRPSPCRNSPFFPYEVSACLLDSCSLLSCTDLLYSAYFRRCMGILRASRLGLQHIPEPIPLRTPRPTFVAMLQCSPVALILFTSWHRRGRSHRLRVGTC